MAKIKSSKISSFPSTRCQILGNGQNKLIQNKKIDSIETLFPMIDKLHIDENSSREVTGKSVQKATNREEITEPLRNSTKATVALYDIDGMSCRDLQVSLRKTEEIPQQPFSFLASIYEIFNDKNRLTTEAAKPTEIDVQLAAVAKRIESSRALLEDAKSRVNEIRLRVKRDVSISQRSLDPRSP